MSVIVGFNYFYDEVSCMVFKKSDLQKEFISSSCWISGFYIFEEMKTRLDKSSYYGIPYTINHDGIRKDGTLCATRDRLGLVEGCAPMTKVYYLQYQWMPFYIGSLSTFYYMPYIVFKMVNRDLMTLKAAIKSISNNNIESIVDNYFNHNVTPVFQLRLRICWNIFVKAFYVFSSMSAFYLTDYLLMYNYITYGRDYLRWSIKNSSMLHISAKLRAHAKAGNVLLPSMGFCDIDEAALDSKRTIHNENRLICEISPNILYQYILMVLWFFFVTSIALSIIGMATYICHLSYHMFFHGFGSPKRNVYQYLTLRELQYLDFIKANNMVVYGNVLRKLPLNRNDLDGKLGDEYNANGCQHKTNCHDRRRNFRQLSLQKSYHVTAFE